MHLNEEELIAHYYGDGNGDGDGGGEGDAGAGADHLASCAACTAELESLKRTLGLIESWPVPERGPGYGQQVWQRLVRRAPAMAAAPPRWWRRWGSGPRLALVGAVAVLLMGAFLLGRASRQVEPPTAGDRGSGPGPTADPGGGAERSPGGVRAHPARDPQPGGQAAGGHRRRAAARARSCSRTTGFTGRRRRAKGTWPWPACSRTWSGCCWTWPAAPATCRRRSCRASGPGSTIRRWCSRSGCWSCGSGSWRRAVRPDEQGMKRQIETVEKSR